ncbi:hypothetical protein BDU57DRAFT_558284 [Ampelomyces quisqualis]|uniref:F-box domain-containing protein n=1 Tax=Ampelomyces quisqualis TaxID=50730 RepID=A0A6A5QJ59_AMPQU|nr:hypothetical protein BDU57DRAFT_558284 [Ampelomyces quisqualis]
MGGRGVRWRGGILQRRRASLTTTQHLPANTMASRTARSSSHSSRSSDTTMLDAPRNPPTAAQPAALDPAFSLLLALPRELRERIYAFALTSPYPFWWPSQAPLKHSVGASLLRTCRQVHGESASILYTANKFLFTHPSDCNIFRVVASPASRNIACVYLRIREKDLRLWTAYLGSKTAERSLKSDLPKLKHLWIFMRCGSMGTPATLGQLAHGGMGLQAAPLAGLPPAVAVQVQAVQAALGQQVAALQQQLHNPPANPGHVQANLIPLHPAMPFAQFQQGPLPPPPPPPPPHHPAAPPANTPALFAHQQHGHAQPHSLYTSFLLFEREMGIESLCLSLQETRREETQVKIVCIMRIPRREVDRLCTMYPEELERDRHGDARTRFRTLHGTEVSLEISGYDLPGLEYR